MIGCSRKRGKLQDILSNKSVLYGGNQVQLKNLKKLCCSKTRISVTICKLGLALISLQTRPFFIFQSTLVSPYRLHLR